MLVLSGVSIAIGVADLSFATPDGLQLLWISRLPRTFAIILTGISLSVSGVIVQLLVRNRFVEPSTTGTTEAAMLGLLAVAVWFPGWPILAKLALASLSSLCSLLIFFALARRLPPQQPLLIPLVGLIYGGILGAMATYFAFQTNLLQFLAAWMTGEFSGILAGRYEFLWIAGVLAALSYFAADQLSIAALGRRTSMLLGLNYQRVFVFGVVVVAVSSSLVVVTVGMMPFLGLVVPNMVSRLMGDNLRETLPVVASLGAVFLLLADIIGRVIRYPFEIPAGTIFGVIGAGLFLWFLFNRRAYG